MKYIAIILMYLFLTTPVFSNEKICGDAKILGKYLSTIHGKIKECGIVRPVKVLSVDGVRLSTGATLDCKTARALKKWVSDVARPQLEKRGKLAELHIIGSYGCRRRNNKSSGKMSEHSFGHAVDIAGFKLKNGLRITILNDWKQSPYSKALYRMHDKACGIFGTVLGPSANKYHLDHFHFDTARYRNGSYCR